MSSPENVDPVSSQPGPSNVPEAPQKTRYGRIVVPKGAMPGEDQVAKDRRKKRDRREDTTKPKRKYTKRKDKKPADGEKKVIKEEVDEERRVAHPKSATPENIDEYCVVPKRTTALPVPPPIKMPDFDNNETCDICGAITAKYLMEQHQMDKHPEYPRYDCLSCGVRSFFTYFDLKAHYRRCSLGRIALPRDASEPEAAQVVEAPFFMCLYEPVECPFCKIYVATFFDMDLHFSAHGLSNLDAKYGCEGCKRTFETVEQIHSHLLNRNRTLRHGPCFNKGRVLNRREIEKLMERFTDDQRDQCMPRFNNTEFVLQPPKILESSETGECGYCGEVTRAYVLLLRDVSNLVTYGLRCQSAAFEAEVVERIKDRPAFRKAGDRVPVCRNHFEWRNWTLKDHEDRMARLQRRFCRPRPVKPRSEKEQSVEILEDFDDLLREEKARDADGVTKAEKSATTTTAVYRPMHQSTKKKAPKDQDDYARYVACRKNDPVYSQIKLEETAEFLVDADEVLEDLNKERPPQEDEEEEEMIELSDDEDDCVVVGGRVALPTVEEGELEARIDAAINTAYVCPICHATFPNLDLFHLHSHENTRVIYTCVDCPGKTLVTPDEVKEHFDEKLQSPLAAFYAFKVTVDIEMLGEPEPVLQEEEEMGEEEGEAFQEEQPPAEMMMVE